MAAAPAGSQNGTPAPPPDARKEQLSRTLYQKLAQGFEIESESETKAVVVMKGRRRWFGLANAPSARHEVTVDEAGNATSRRL